MGLLQLRAGEIDVLLPIDDAVMTAVSPTLTPLPLAGQSVEGMAVIDGFPVVQIDLVQLLTGKPGTGRIVAVVNPGGNPVAFRVNHISLATGKSDIPPPISEFLLSFIPTTESIVPGRNRQPGVATLQLLLVRDRGRVIGVPASSIERIDRFEKCGHIQTGSDRRWELVRLDNEVLPACPIPSRLNCQFEEEASWGMIVRHGDKRIIWTAADVIGLHTASCEKMHCITIPNEEPVRWYDAGSADFIEIIDPIGLLNELSTDPLLAAESISVFCGDLHLSCGPFHCLLPLAMIEIVLETMNGVTDQRSAPDDLQVVNAARLLGYTGESRAGRAVVVRLDAGRRIVLVVDEIRDAAAILDGKLHPLPAVPPSVAQLFDGVILNASTEKWIYRFARPTAETLSIWLDALDAAYIGWMPAECVESGNQSLPP